MQRAEFLKLIGGKSEGGDYVPVSCLLRNGFACAGYVNLAINEQYSDTCIFVNARMIDLREPGRSERGAIRDFSDFLEEFVLGMMNKKAKDKDFLDEDHEAFEETFSKNIPLTAISFDEIAVVYPVARIGNLLRQVHAEAKSTAQKVPTFLDFENKSVVLKVLMTKLW